MKRQMILFAGGLLPLSPNLVKVHAHLDAFADKAYGLTPAALDSDRVALLFKLYVEKTKGSEALESDSAKSEGIKPGMVLELLRENEVERRTKICIYTNY